MAMFRPACRYFLLRNGPRLVSMRHSVTGQPTLLPFTPTYAHFRPLTSATNPDPIRISWDQFLRLRRQRRLSGVVASIPTSILGIYGGLEYFGSGDIDPTQQILGFDPFIMSFVGVIACGVLGWLAGPTIGRGLWNIFHQKQAKLITQVLSQCGNCVHSNLTERSTIFQTHREE